MKSIYKQIAFTTVLLSLNSFALAIESKDSQSNKKEQPTAPALGDKLPPYNNPNRFVFSGSFIYWRADVDGVDTSLQGFTEQTNTVSPTPPNLSTTNILKNKDLDFEWNPGFKVGVGCVFDERDQWDIFLNWTWLLSKAHRNQSVPSPFLDQSAPSEGGSISNSYLDPSFSISVLRAPVVSSETHWRLNYNTVDLELGRNFFLATNLTVRPHIGLRAAFLHQHTKVNYTMDILAGANTTNPAETIGGEQFKAENDYNGVGLRGGFNLFWNFTNHFCVYSNLSGSILFGNFHVEEIFTANFTNVNISPNTVDTFTKVKNQNHRTRTTLQAILGVMWHTDFNNDKQHLFVSAGYEVNEWFQQNELRYVYGETVDNFQTPRTNGDLGLHGVTVDVRFDF